VRTQHFGARVTRNGLFALLGRNYRDSRPEASATQCICTKNAKLWLGAFECAFQRKMSALTVAKCQCACVLADPGAMPRLRLNRLRALVRVHNFGVGCSSVLRLEFRPIRVNCRPCPVLLEVCQWQAPAQRNWSCRHAWPPQDWRGRLCLPTGVFQDATGRSDGGFDPWQADLES